MLGSVTLADALVTCVCSYLSLVGSLLVLTSYFVARTKTMPRTATLILHLAASDFIWFSVSAIESTYWLSSDGVVPKGLCFVCNPTMVFMRLVSLLWTCVISFNVLMSVQRRKWLWQCDDESWGTYRRRYYVIILLLALPATLLGIVKQHRGGNYNLGCSPEYESLGLWYEVFFPELLPMLVGLLFNIFVYTQVRSRMLQSAYPQSVRKRRKRIMYHYVILCIVCWSPTVSAYLIELMGYHTAALEITARLCLYSSGFLNFLVFGMQDPHLKKAFVVVMHTIGLHVCCMSGNYFEQSLASESSLKTAPVEKFVMFEEGSLTRNADIPKGRHSFHRHKKLSKEDKIRLFRTRPDLFVRNPSLSSRSEGRRGKLGGSTEKKSDGSMTSPLLSDAFELNQESILRLQSSSVSSGGVSGFHPNELLMIDQKTAVSDISIDSVKEDFDRLFTDDSSSDDDSDEEDQHIISAVQSVIASSSK